MAAFITANMAPLMFASLVIVLLLGYPVAFALAFNGLASAASVGIRARPLLADRSSRPARPRSSA